MALKGLWSSLVPETCLLNLTQTVSATPTSLRSTLTLRWPGLLVSKNPDLCVLFNFVSRLKGVEDIGKTQGVVKQSRVFFSQFHGCFGSSKRHVLALGPTEHHSLHFCPHLGTTSSRSGRCQITSHRAQTGEVQPATAYKELWYEISSTNREYSNKKKNKTRPEILQLKRINVVVTNIILPDLVNLTTLEGLHRSQKSVF